MIYDFDMFMALYIIIALSAYIGFVVLLIRHADLVVKALRLDKGFEEERMDISDINMRKIISLAIIIVGGILVVTNFSTLLVTICSFFASMVGTKKDMGPVLSPDLFNRALIVDLIDFFIGLIIIMNYKPISGYIVRKGEKKTDDIS